MEEISGGECEGEDMDQWVQPYSHILHLHSQTKNLLANIYLLQRLQTHKEEEEEEEEEEEGDDR